MRIGIDVRKARDSGIGTYIRQLVASIAAASRGVAHEFVLFCRPGDAGFFASLPANFAPVEESAAGYSIAELTTFGRRIRAQRLDLFHATHYVVPLRLGIPFVVTIHDIIHLLFPDDYGGPLRTFYARTMLRRAVSSSSRIITVSENTRRDLLERLGAKGSKITVIPNGIAATFHPGISLEEVSRVAATHRLAPRYALYLGGAKPHKNVANVVRAFARARDLGARSLSLVLAGSMPEPEGPLRALLGKFRLGPWVRLLGFVPENDLPGLYAGALCFVYPSRYEGFGLPVGEAMACGVPVITSSGSALREIAEGAALLVDPDSVEEIAAALVRIDADPALRGELRAKGIERSRRFTWAEAAERTLNTYEGALA